MAITRVEVLQPTYSVEVNNLAIPTGPGATIKTTGIRVVGDELVTNGKFDTDSGWTKSEFTIFNGQAIATAGTTSYIDQPIQFVSGKSYEIALDIISITGGSASIQARGVTTVASTITSVDSGTTYRFIYTDTSDNTTLRVYAGVDTNLIVDNISVKEIALIANLDDGVIVNDLDVKGVLKGPSTFIIDPATHEDNTGTVVVAGNLQVDGTTTIINSTTVAVDDKNLTLASGSINAAAADGAGLTVDCGSDTDATFIYDGINDQWELNKNLDVQGIARFNNTSSNYLEIDGSEAGTNNVVIQSRFNGLILNAPTGAVDPFLQFQTGGANRLRIDSTGKVGVGTISPSSFFHLRNLNPDIRFEDTSGFNHYLISNYSEFRAQADSILTLYTSGSEAMRIDSTGKVGIGTTTPGELLEISNSGSANLKLTNEAEGIDLIIGAQASAARITAGSGDTLRLGANNTPDILTIATNGRVGLGTTDPGAPIDISASVPKIRFTDSDVVNAYSEVSGSGGHLALLADVLGGAGGTRIEFSLDGSEKMRLDLNGNLGIGTTAPALQSGGTGLHLNDTNYSEIKFTNSTTGVAATDGTALVSSGLNFEINNREAGNLTLRTFNTDRLLINSIGNVGIGTNSPATALDVNGVITADGLTVEDNGGTAQVIVSNSALGNYVAPKFSDVLFKGYNSSDKARIRVVDETGNIFGGRILIETADAFSNDQSALKSRINVERNGDISFYEDTGTTPKFFWDASTERLGIGTTSPARQLHIQSNGPDAYLRLNSTGNNSWALLELANDATTWTTGVNNVESFVINNGSTERMRIDSSGNVGIGTTTPAHTLDVSGTGHFTGALTLDSTLSVGDITTTGYLRGPSSFVIDPATHGDDTGTVIIAGNLQVDGTTTTINSTTLTVEDKNITLASGAINAAAADGAGISVDCGSDTDATFIYDGINDQWELNKEVAANSFNATATGTGYKLNGTTILNYSGGYVVVGDTGAGVGLDYSGSRKLNTTSTGIDVTGTVTADGLTVDGSLGDWSIDSQGAIQDFGFAGTNYIRASNASGALRFGSGGQNNRLNIASNGDISFYEDTGTTPKFLWNASAERLVLETSGAYSLDARASSMLSATMAVFSNSAGSDKAAIRLDAQGDGELVLIDAGNNEDVVITSGGNTYFNGGNVGIGTTSPDGLLEISADSDDGTAAPSFLITNASTTLNNGAVIGTIEFKNSDTSGTGPHVAKIQGIANSSDERTAELAFSTGFVASTTERMRITHNGNVGIGTTSPASKLTVSDSGAQGFEIEPNAAGFVALQSYNRSTNVFSPSSIAAEYLDIKTGTTSSSNRVRVTSSGNVGIGTISPAYKLDVVTVSTTQARFAYDSNNYVEVNYNGFNVVGGNMLFKHSGTERMRLDTAGNLLISTTSAVVANASSNVGTAIGSGLIESARAGVVAQLNRHSTDGTILDFQKNGSAVGSIGTTNENLYVDFGGWTITESNGSLYFATGGVNKMKLDASGNLQVVGSVEANATIS